MDKDLDTLLALDGVSMNVQGEYWVKIEAWKVTQGSTLWRGIHYSLTLHDGNNTRIMGYDNAHAIKVSSGFKGKRYAFDHRHRFAGDKGVAYEFKTAGQLLEDFWSDVNRILKNREADNESY